jgi:Putative zinc-finger/Predicted integral membrane protein (DUF2275)
MEHNDIRHMLSDYLDGSLAAQEKAELEEHLKACPVCENALRELRKTIEQIKAIEEIEPPALMTQKIMAKVRAEAKGKTSIFHKLFYPLAIKLPIQAVAITFLAVTTFYVYLSIRPAAKFEATPLPETTQFAVKKDTPPFVSNRDEQNMPRDSRLRSKQVTQAPEYKSLDMKPEYKAPSLPSPKDQAAASAPTSAPAKLVEQSAPEKNQMILGKHATARQSPGKVQMQGQAASASGTPAPSQANSESLDSLKKAKEPADKTEAGRRLERDIIERHSNGEPKLVVTYEIIDLLKVRLTEERFNLEGDRHGIQKEFYASGQLKTEAQYGDGKLDWYREYGPDGLKKIGKSNYDWFWLKK